jgi:hypothetical protein
VASIEIEIRFEVERQEFLIRQLGTATPAADGVPAFGRDLDLPETADPMTVTFAVRYGVANAKECVEAVRKARSALLNGSSKWLILHYHQLLSTLQRREDRDREGGLKLAVREARAAVAAGSASGDLTWKVRLPVLPGFTLPRADELEALKTELGSALFSGSGAAPASELEVEDDGTHLVLTVSNCPDKEIERTVAKLCELLEAGPIASRQPIRRPARSQPWVVGSAVIAALTVGFSLLPLSAGWLLLLGAVVALVAAFVCASGDGDVRATLLRMTPILLLVAFALIYGAADTQNGCTAGPGGATGDGVQSPDADAHLRDPLILSLQAMVTGGFGDLKVCGWPRTVVYLEMLLLWGFVAAAVIQFARRFTNIDDALVRVREQERRSGE